MAEAASQVVVDRQAGIEDFQLAERLHSMKGVENSRASLLRPVCA
jgi:hypothetical protein